MHRRIVSIDILKFIAAILITNSHLDILYPNDDYATGGAIGNALFFFCSGFTIFLKPVGRFDNFYKRRISRIFPTVFTWALLAYTCFNEKENIFYILFYGSGWFISCIMVHYVLLYFVEKFLSKYLVHVFLSFLIAVLSFVFWCCFSQTDYNSYSLYADVYVFRWVYYFLFVLLGAISATYRRNQVCNFKLNILKLLGLLVFFYGLLFMARENVFFNKIQVVSLFPLLGITFYFHKVVSSSSVKRFYDRKIPRLIIRTIGGLCLEIYLIQKYLIFDSLNNIFPANIIIVLLVIILGAYILRTLSRIMSQIFRDQDFDWKAVFNLY